MGSRLHPKCLPALLVLHSSSFVSNPDVRFSELKNRYREMLRNGTGGNTVIMLVNPDPVGSTSCWRIRIHSATIVKLTSKLYPTFFQKISKYCPNIESYDTYDAGEKDKFMLTKFIKKIINFGKFILSKTVIYGFLNPYKRRLDCSNMEFFFLPFLGANFDLPNLDPDWLTQLNTDKIRNRNRNTALKSEAWSF